MFKAALVEAARDLGIPSFAAPNGGMMEGCGGASINDLITRDGRRQSIYRSHVHPMRGRPNLVVLTGALATRLLLTGTALEGVEVLSGGILTNLRARKEVVLSLGAVNTPKVLMQSGIEPADELARHGIRTIQPLPGVGEIIKTMSRSGASSRRSRRFQSGKEDRRRRFTGRAIRR